MSPLLNPILGFRYTCEQGENIHGYGWDEYDARTGGVQSIHDEGNNIDITTSFVKVPGGSHGGSWAARIKGELREDAAPDTKTMLYYYIAQEGAGELTADTESTEFGFTSDLALKGHSEALGDYKLVVTEGKGEHPTSDDELLKARHGDKTLLYSVDLPDEMMWQAKSIVFQRLQEAVLEVEEDIDLENPPPAWQLYRLNNKPGSGNVQIVQKTFEGSFEFDVIFSSASAGKELTSADVTHEAKATSQSFNDRFSSIFDLKAPFTADKYQKFAKSMFSNLFGGVGYFEGFQLIDRSYAPEYDEESEGFWEDTAAARARKEYKLEGPYELFTSVPSRPFFPRGFLWDEGFHLLLIGDWDLQITLDIVKSWFNTMDADGWIPREQILGPEARTKVPEEFQVQYPHYANPPTLFLVVEELLDRVGTLGEIDMSGDWLSSGSPLYTGQVSKTAAQDYIRELYPQLRKQYDWFRKTQRGDIKSYDREAFSTREAYRWRGRTETHVLTSGLDDYPRPQPPHPAELHVDLMAWVGLMTKSLLRIAQELDMQDEVPELKKNLHALERNLGDLHWSEAEGCYCDATIDDFEEHKLVCHKGYISIFPFLVGLMKPDDAKLGKILDLIGAENHLFSPHGIRSLSKQDEHYGTGENYWRSPVWMPINYMVVSQLHVSPRPLCSETNSFASFFFLFGADELSTQNVATQAGPFKSQARDLYSRLRRNLVTTVYESWEQTGFAWEQYNPDTGAGQRTQHFTGWTSLVVKIMAMEDLGGGHARDEL